MYRRREEAAVAIHARRHLQAGRVHNVYCNCVYEQSLNKCGSDLTCKDTATGEYNVCTGTCLSEKSDC